MPEPTTPNRLSPFKTIQQRISVTTWLITLLLSLRGLFAFYGMKDKGSVEQVITFVTEPAVRLFSFDPITAIGIPGISVLFAAVSILLISNMLQIGLWLTEQRQIRVQEYVARQAIHSK